MTVGTGAKSILDIVVNDEQFRNYAAKFDQYKKALGEMPASWKAVGEEIGKTGAVFEQVLSALLVEKDISKQIADAEKEQARAAEKERKERERAARSGALHWRDMARTTRDVAGHIIKATGALLKWGGLTSVITGLVGAGGGLYGIDRMATGIAAGRRSSQGLGIGYGEQKAFGIDFGPVVDSGAFLGAVNEALHSWEGKSGFFGAGMSPGEMQGTTAEVGSALLRHLKQIADNTNPAGLSNVMKARGLDQFATLEDMMRLRAMSPQEFDKFQSRNAADASNLNLSRDTQDAWLSFSQQMSRAGIQIENVFARGLLKLERPLENVSDGLVHLIDAVSRSPVIEKWMNELASGLEKFAGYVGTPEFEQKVESFIGALGKIVTAVEWVAKKTGLITDDKPTTDDKTVFKAPGITVRRDDRSLWERLVHPGIPKQSAGGASGSWESGDFGQLEKDNGLTPGLLNAIYKTESDSGKDTRTSPAGAKGPFQFMPQTAKDYGVADPTDLAGASSGAAHLLSDLKREFKGDLAKMVAAYNWGAGNVESYIKTGRGMYGQSMPQETIDYLAKISQALSKQTGHKIVLDINNSSGANVTVAASQVAQ